jgi:hypothetical protein
MPNIWIQIIVALAYGCIVTMGAVWIAEKLSKR